MNIDEEILKEGREKMSIMNFVQAVVVTVAALMVPIGIMFSILNLRRSMREDAKERFEVATQLQNSIFNMMTAIILSIIRGANNNPPPSSTYYTDYTDNKYEDWCLYTSEQLPLLKNNKNMTKKSVSSALIGFFAGLSVFLLLALITILLAR